jgi:hypothetical protein
MRNVIKHYSNNDYWFEEDGIFYLKNWNKHKIVAAFKFVKFKPFDKLYYYMMTKKL